MEITCPKCKTEFEAEIWDSGNCPSCNNEYSWDEQCTEDYSDCWITLEWEKYE